MPHRWHTASEAYHLVRRVSRYHGERRVVAGPKGGRRPPAGPVLRRVKEVVTTGSSPIASVLSDGLTGPPTLEPRQSCLHPDAPRGSLVAGAARRTSGLIRGDDEVHPEVVDGLRDRLVHHLERVDRGGQHRVGPNHASLNQEGNLEVGESSALCRREHPGGSRPRSRRPPGPPMAAPWLRPSSRLGCAFLGGRFPWGRAQVLRVQQVEGQLIS
jgi:hypothetical protein